MASVHVVRRKLESGRRYYVRFQKDSGAALVHVGTCRTLEEANELVKATREAFARGVEPVPVRKRKARAREKGTLRETADAWVASRIDAAENTRKNWRVLLPRILDELGDLPPDRIGVADVQAWVEQLKVHPRSVPKYIGVLRQVLDFADVEPNPARDRRVKLPRRERREVRLPSRAELVAVHAAVHERYRKPLRLLEETGLRISEAVRLTYEDVDVPRGRLLVRDAKTSAGRRWVPAPAWLVAEAKDGERGRVVPMSGNAVESALRAGAERAGVEHLTPHTLRHLFASRQMHEQRASPAELAAVLGHADPAITLSVYTHLTAPD